MKRWLAVGLLGAALLSGCSARTAVEVDVTGSNSARVTVSAAFTAEAADVLRESPALLEDLVDTFTAQAGVTPDVQDDKDGVRVSAEVDYAQLEKLSSITGVKSVALSEADEGVQAVASVVPAKDLATAIEAAVLSSVGEGANGAATAQTMLASSTIVLRLSFAGGLTEEPVASDAKLGQVTSDGRTVTLERSAGSSASGTLTATGRTFNAAPWVFGGALVVLGVAGASIAVVAVRRR